MFNDTDNKKARANLILISSAVLLFVYGGGSFGTATESSNKISIFGGSMSFSDPNALNTAGVLMFAYMLWRFLLSTGGTIKEFRWDIWTLLYTSRTYKTVRDKWIEDVPITDKHKNQIINGSVFTKRVDDNGFFPPRISGLLPSTLVFYNAGALPVNRTNDYPFNCDFENITQGSISKSDSWRLLFTQIVCFFEAIIFRRGFTDVVFPFLIGGVACFDLAGMVTGNHPPLLILLGIL